MRTLLVDGDISIYQVAAAAEVATDWGNGLWTLHSDEYEAKFQLDEVFSRYKEVLEADKMIVALSDTRSFRYDVYPDYKHNRVGKRQPLLRQRLKEYVLDNYNTYLRPNLEGDDVLGILATSTVIIPKGEKIIVSEDKDMKTIPGLICNFKKYEEEGIKSISPEEARYWHMYQTLTGDAADGYKGCPSCGPKTAEKILGEDPSEWTYEIMWQKVVEAYEKKGLTEADALQIARIARICQKEDYNYKERKVILWTPPSLK